MWGAPGSLSILQHVIRQNAVQLRVEYVSAFANVDLRFEVRDLKVIIAFLQHPPKRHVRIVAMPRDVQRRHPEWISLDLERVLIAEKGFSRERIDLGNLLIGHGVAAG